VCGSLTPRGVQGNLELMPYRKVPIVEGEIYHVLNRSVARLPIFLNGRDYQRALETLYFYTFKELTLRFSHFNRLAEDQKKKFLKSLEQNGKRLIQVLAYCLMPNHIHFLIKEINEGGITAFTRNFQNSYAKYFNTKNDRNGSLFQSRFKAVRIETDEQLIHVGRYIHLNPLTAYVIKNPEELENYPWCSFSEYLGKQKLNIIADKKMLLSYFHSPNQFKKFTFDQMDYQRKLDRIKHLIAE